MDVATPSISECEVNRLSRRKRAGPGRSRELRKRGPIPKVSPAWLDDNPLIRYEFIVVEGEPPRHARLPLGTTARIVRAIAPLADRIELGQPSPDQLAELPDVAKAFSALEPHRSGGSIRVGRLEGESYSLALDQVAFAPWAALLVDDASDPDGDEILRVSRRRIERMVLTRHERRIVERILREASPSYQVRTFF